MKKRSILKKSIIVAIITIFFTTSILPSISGEKNEINEEQIIISKQITEEKDNDVDVTFYSFGINEQSTNQIQMSSDEVEILLNKISEYSLESAKASDTNDAVVLKNEIFTQFDELGLLPQDIQENFYTSVLNRKTSLFPISPLSTRASAFFCNFATTGTGSQFPVIIFPRLIPIIQLPIPRAFLRWTATEGITSCGGLVNGKGYIACGQQKGTALGFWGIGFSVFLPPIMQYGFIGYALFASTDADVIELWPPNNPPEISQINPGDGEIDVSISLPELQFQISDFDEELMSYTVTTSPDIGSGSGNLKPDGVYSIPISNLEDLTEYSWHIEVTDGMDTTVNDYTFTTEAIAPIVSNPSPEDGERYVSLSLSHLSFHLKDFQGDSMDYSVETVPDIGSGSGFGVGEGTYSIPVSGLDYSVEYTWYVNATDGEHEANKIFYFQTEPIMVFDPFDEGWQYRKEITIDHTKVDGDLENLPILISTTDVDLHDKAQDDGDDILFMDGSGMANRLYHEIEHYESSSGKLVAWVNATSLSSTTDTVIWLYYGNPDCSSQQHSIVVWDSNYLAVFHMSETSGAIQDSTGKANHFIKYGFPTYQQAGQIGYGIRGNGYDAYFSNSDMNLKDLSAQTLEVWFQIGDITEGHGSHIFGSKYDTWDDIRFGYRNHESKMGFATTWDDGTTELGADYTHNWNLDEWHHSTGTIQNGDKAVLYTDGVQVLLDDDVDFNFNGLDNIHIIGRRTVSSPHYYNGIIDEFRISDIARTAEWIQTQYNNQNDPSSFMSIGIEVPAP